MNKSPHTAMVNQYRLYAYKDRAQFLDHICEKHKILVAMNAEKILRNDDQLRRIVNNNIGYADGIGAVMALRQKGLDAVKIPGAEFWLDIVGRFKNEKSFYLVGSEQHVIEETVSKLQREFPGINVVGYQNGYMTKAQETALKKTLAQARPDVVFVAQGSPKQEFLMEKLIAMHPALYMGLGGSFDLYTGKTKPVPGWWKNYLKWEGAYRCLTDSVNLSRWKRQVAVPAYLIKLILRKL